MNKGEYLSKVMDHKGYGFPELAKESGVPYTTIKSMFERDLAKASVDNVIKVCRVLGLSVDKIATVDTFIDEDVESSSYKAMDERSILIPMYGNIAAGALSAIDAVEESNVSKIKIPQIFIEKQINPNDLFALKVNGDSMNLIIPNESIVIAKPINHEDVKEDDIVIFSHDGEYSMKRFHRDEQDQVLVFSPESSSRTYRETVIPFNTQNDLKIIAKVIWYGVSL